MIRINDIDIDRFSLSLSVGTHVGDEELTRIRPAMPGRTGVADSSAAATGLSPPHRRRTN